MMNRIGFSIPPLTWIRRSLNHFNIKGADLFSEIAVGSTEMRGFHSDPADQIITATARIPGLPLVTSDKQILGYTEINTIW